MNREVEAAEQHPQHSGPAGTKRLYVIRVDGNPVEMRNPEPTGKDILKEAGRKPPDQHLLIQLMERGSRSISLEETVKLKGEGIELFRSFLGDRIYRLLIDGDGYDWGAGSISETDLRELAALPPEFALELVEKDSGRVLEPGEEVSLDGKGVERFKRVKRLIKVYLGEQEHRIPPGTYTTEQLIKVLGVQPGYLLSVIRGNELVLLQPGQKTEVENCMRFVEQVPCGGAS